MLIVLNILCCTIGTNGASDDENDDTNGNVIAESSAHHGTYGCSWCATFDCFIVFIGEDQHVGANMSPHMEMQFEIVPNEAAVITSPQPGTPQSAVSNVPASTASNVPTSAVSNVPTSAVSNVPTSAVSKAPTSAVSKVPTSAVSNVPTSVVSSVPTSAVSNVHTPAAAGVPGHDAHNSGGKKKKKKKDK